MDKLSLGGETKLGEDLANGGRMFAAGDCSESQGVINAGYSMSSSPLRRPSLVGFRPESFSVAIHGSN
jgi:hypothetical protein